MSHRLAGLSFCLLAALVLASLPSNRVVAGAPMSCGTAPSCVPVKSRPTLAKGMKVNIGGYRLWIQCVGMGSPTVVLDSGLGSDSTVWLQIESATKGFTHVCIYDRANLGGSDHRPGGTAMRVVKELHTLLRKVKVSAPYVLVGHSIGGINMRLYTYTYPYEVKGMVWIDSSHEDQSLRYCAATPGCHPSTLHQGASQNIEFYDVETSLDQIRAANHDRERGSLGSRPLIVLTHDASATQPCNAACRGDEDIWRSLQADLATASSDSLHAVGVGRDHVGMVNLATKLDVESIREVVAAVHTGSKLPVCGKAIVAAGGACVRS